MQNTTDYTFPAMWGRMSDDEKCEWFLKERVWRQMKRQHREGMWSQFDDKNGKPLGKAWAEASKNNFRIK